MKAEREERELEQGSAAWFLAREQCITASKFGVICEVDRYATCCSLWELKTGRLQVEDDDDDEEEENEHTARGILFECVAIAFYEKIMQVKVEKVGFARKPPYGASPDGMVLEGSLPPRLLEIKCPAWNLHETIPDTYMCQIQGQMEIWDEEWCDFCSWHQQHGMRVWRVKRNPQYWAWMEPQLARFHQCLIDDVPPPLRSERIHMLPPNCECEDLGVFKSYA